MVFHQKDSPEGTGSNGKLGDNDFMPFRVWLVAWVVFLSVIPYPGHGQESQWQSLAGEASAMSRKISPEKMDYNLDPGPVLLNVGTVS